jgi:hypothetical protein
MAFLRTICILLLTRELWPDGRCFLIQSWKLLICTLIGLIVLTLDWCPTSWRNILCGYCTFLLFSILYLANYPTLLRCLYIDCNFYSICSLSANILLSCCSFNTELRVVPSFFVSLFSVLFSSQQFIFAVTFDLFAFVSSATFRLWTYFWFLISLTPFLSPENLNWLLIGEYPVSVSSVIYSCNLHGVG